MRRTSGRSRSEHGPASCRSPRLEIEPSRPCDVAGRTLNCHTMRRLLFLLFLGVLGIAPAHPTGPLGRGGFVQLEAVMASAGSRTTDQDACILRAPPPPRLLRAVRRAVQR